MGDKRMSDLNAVDYTQFGDQSRKHMHKTSFHSGFEKRVTLTHGRISQKNTDEAVDQRRKQSSVC